MTSDQKAALDLAVLNLKTHGDDQLLSAVKPLIDFYERSGKQEPVGELALGECTNGYSTPWTFRLYEGVQARPMQLYAAPPKPCLHVRLHNDTCEDCGATFLFI